jgi:drug/metabolite transporter (DMT)-like permease
LVRSTRTGVAFAFICLVILGAMPVLSNARPAELGGLTFTIWLTFWQLIAALPLFAVERAGAKKSGKADAPKLTGRAIAIALATGAMFGLSTWMYVVAAEKAGPVNMIIALQAYPLFAMIIEAVFLGKRKTVPEIGFTLLMIAAIVFLTTEGTFRLSEISWWSAFALGIPMLWAVAHILIRQVLVAAQVTPNQITVSRLVISGIFLLALYGATVADGTLTAALTDFAFQRAAIVMGLAYYVELILWFNAVRHIDVSLASSITVPAPAVTMLIAVAILGDAVQTYQILALCVVVVAMYGLLLAGKRADARRAAQA